MPDLRGVYLEPSNKMSDSLEKNCKRGRVDVIKG